MNTELSNKVATKTSPFPSLSEHSLRPCPQRIAAATRLLPCFLPQTTARHRNATVFLRGRGSNKSHFRGMGNSELTLAAYPFIQPHGYYTADAFGDAVSNHRKRRETLSSFESYTAKTLFQMYRVASLFFLCCC